MRLSPRSVFLLVLVSMMSMIFWGHVDAKADVPARDTRNVTKTATTEPAAKAAAKKMNEDELTCGQEIAADAEVPEKLGRLMAHVATNMEVHARWAATDPRGTRERDGLLAIAREYQAMADAAMRAAVAMRAMKDLPQTPHDPARLDRAGQTRWMREKIALQLEFARLLVAHAEVSKRVLAQLESHADGAAGVGAEAGRPATKR
jgi:hypothetical protein